MYSIVTTDGFVLDSRPYGESSKLLFIFTRDQGLVRAMAQGIRVEKSKLRYFTQNHSRGIYSLVRGKEHWRLTSAQAYSSRSDELDKDDRVQSKEDGQHLELKAKIASLLIRLIHGEEAHPKLFECLIESLDYLEGAQQFSDDEISTLESVTVLRILIMMGYIGTEPFLDEKMRSGRIDSTLLDELAPLRKEINKRINKALSETHL